MSCCVLRVALIGRRISRQELHIEPQKWHSEKETEEHPSERESLSVPRGSGRPETRDTVPCRGWSDPVSLETGAVVGFPAVWAARRLVISARARWRDELPAHTHTHTQTVAEDQPEAAPSPAQPSARDWAWSWEEAWARNVGRSGVHSCGAGHRHQVATDYAPEFGQHIVIRASSAIVDWDERRRRISRRLLGPETSRSV